MSRLMNYIYTESNGEKVLLSKYKNVHDNFVIIEHERLKQGCAKAQYYHIAQIDSVWTQLKRYRYTFNLARNVNMYFNVGFYDASM